MEDDECNEFERYCYCCVGDSNLHQSDNNVTNGTKRAFTMYIDFDVKSREYNTFHTEDYSWDEQCFPFINAYFPGAVSINIYKKDPFIIL